jgi:hypothetical protein
MMTASSAYSEVVKDAINDIGTRNDIVYEIRLGFTTLSGFAWPHERHCIMMWCESLSAPYFFFKRLMKAKALFRFVFYGDDLFQCWSFSFFLACLHGLRVPLCLRYM